MPKFQNDPAMFQLKSGNKPPFKSMGSSPLYQNEETSEQKESRMRGELTESYQNIQPNTTEAVSTSVAKPVTPEVTMDEKEESIEAGKAGMSATMEKSPVKQSKWHYAAPGPKTSEFFKKARKTGKEMAKRDMAKSGHGAIKDLEAKSKARKGFPKSFNITGSSASDTPGYKDTKMAKAARVGKKVAKVAKKVGKVMGGKTLGVAGMLMGKTASADQPGTGTHG